MPMVLAWMTSKNGFCASWLNNRLRGEAALRARFDANATFLRLPFERSDAATDEEMQSAVVKHRVSGDLFAVLQLNNQG